MATQLGLRANWRQFGLLVLINAFVGGMVGLERSILPRLAEQEFHLVARSAILSFIVVFGLTKAAANYYAGAWAGWVGRRNLLLIGWLFGLPVPLLLLWAPSWGWVIAANVLLGLNQGLAWSSTVVMKMDLVGPKQRGLAMGLNESAGYLAVGATAFASGWLATEYGLRPYPFYLGLALAVLGLLGSLLVRDTRAHVALEAAQAPASPAEPPLSFWDVSWRHPNLGSVTQAGLVNNLNDGMVWGLLPLLLAGKGYTLTQIGTVAAVYPAVWGLGQLLTGPLADRLCKKDLLFWGMLLQGAVLLAMLFVDSYPGFLALAALLGAGTALVYPTFLAAVSEYAPAAQRARSVGIFRCWRDAGYAIGALLTGVLADAFGLGAALAAIGGLTVFSAFVIQYRMYCLPEAPGEPGTAPACPRPGQPLSPASPPLRNVFRPRLVLLNGAGPLAVFSSLFSFRMLATPRSLLLLLTCATSLCSVAQAQTLRVYGPGGPAEPLKECAAAFTKQTGTAVDVTAGPEAQWLEKALQDADVVYGGAEYMLTQTALAHPGFLDEKTRASLYAREAAVLVRSGNPRRIRRLQDLARPGVRLLDVNGAGQLGMPEDMARTTDLIVGLQRNVARSVKSSAEAVTLWQQQPEAFDAWITYASWQPRLPGSALVRLPRAQRVSRGTPVALTTRTTQAAAARQFVAFLQSNEGHAIFRKWGWQ